jgi:hypothetical protein
MNWRQNPAQVEWRQKEPTTWKWFAIYCIFGKHL